DRDDALLASLAAHLDLLGDQIEVAAAEALQLRQAHAGRVEQLEDGEIADVEHRAVGRAELGQLEQQIDLGAVEIPGQVFLELRSADGAGGVRLDALVAVQISIEAADRGECAGHRALREAAPGEVPEEGAHHDPVDAAPAPRLAAVVPVEELDELAEIAAVRGHRVRRDVALLAEMIQIRGDVVRAVAHDAAPAGAYESRHCVMSASARSASCSRLARLSRTGVGRSSTRPKLAFIG